MEEYKTPAISCSYVRTARKDIEEYKEQRCNIQHAVITWW
jgi:hypothetical protein